MFKTFVVIAAVADDGYGGCEIWLNTKIIIGYHDGRAQYLQPQNGPILVAKSRLLIAAVRTSCFQFIAICMHAPDSSWSTEDIDSWWKDTFNDMGNAIPALPRLKLQTEFLALVTSGTLLLPARIRRP